MAWACCQWQVALQTICVDCLTGFRVWFHVWLGRVDLIIVADLDCGDVSIALNRPNFALIWLDLHLSNGL